MIRPFIPSLLCVLLRRANSVLFIASCRYGLRAQVTTARNLNDYAALIDAMVSQPGMLREYRQCGPSPCLPERNI